MRYEEVVKTSSDCMALSGAGSLSSSTAIPSIRSVKFSASITEIPQLPEGGVGKGFSSSSLSMNLSTPSYGGTTAEAMKDSRDFLSKYKRSSLDPSYAICTILLVAYSSLFGKSS